jgi:hypothetical protein
VVNEQKRNAVFPPSVREHTDRLAIGLNQISRSLEPEPVASSVSTMTKSNPFVPSIRSSSSIPPLSIGRIVYAKDRSRKASCPCVRFLIRPELLLSFPSRSRRGTRSGVLILKWPAKDSPRVSDNASEEKAAEQNLGGSLSTTANLAEAILVAETTAKGAHRINSRPECSANSGDRV